MMNGLLNECNDWKLSFVGTPEGIRRAMEKYVQSLEGDHKDTFEIARPVLDRLMDLNNEANGEIVLTANGDDSCISVVLIPSKATHVA